jgi:hypothetical protein
MLISSDWHLRLILSEYTGHDNGHRQDPPARRVLPTCRNKLQPRSAPGPPGGLIREYTQVA